MNKSNSRLVNSTRQHDELTHNMAVTHSTSLSNLVDMFFLAGASRTMSSQDIITVFERAHAENPDYALKCLFWARDIRGGAGERRFFRIIWDHIRISVKPSGSEWFANLQELIPEYGRWDDIWYGLDEFNQDVMDQIIAGLTEKNGLLAKWLPRKGQLFNAIRRQLDMTPKDLRKSLVELSNTVEQKMCAKQWSDIEYRTVPSKAMAKYKKAFAKRDETRFDAFIHKVSTGEEKINANAIFPHEVIKEILNGDVDQVGKAQWEALPNYMEGSQERIMPVCDVSGSMTQPNMIPMSVSVALGLYISERNEGLFKDAFITFSGKPEMVYLEGDIISRTSQLRYASWGMNTNIQATFALLLDRAVANNLTENEMPTKVLIISDMEFDRCGGNQTNFQAIDNMYAQVGYKRPQIVFWNVNGRTGNVPINVDDNGTALVSGFSPAILKDILSGTITTPQAFVFKVLNSDRYAEIHA